MSNNNCNTTQYCYTVLLFFLEKQVLYYSFFLEKIIFFILSSHLNEGQLKHNVSLLLIQIY